MTVSSDITAALYNGNDLATPVLDLPLSFTRSWQDSLNDVGMGSITFMFDDPALASIATVGNEQDRYIGFSYRGTRAFTIICEKCQRNLIEPGEEGAENVVWGGRGHGAAFEHALIYPSLGPGVDPPQDTRALDWRQPAYDDSSWVPVTVLGDVATARTTAAGITGQPESDFAAGFPDWSASVLWAAGSDFTLAPPGTCYFRQDLGLMPAGLYIFYFAWDDFGIAYIDGVPVAAIDGRGFLQVQKVAINLTLGTHTIAMVCTNGPPITFPYAPPSSAYAQISIGSTDASSGGAVSVLQTDLNTLGFGVLVVDGIFGGATQTAVTTYQGARGLVVDGIVGPITWGQITAELGGPAPPTWNPAGVAWSMYLGSDANTIIAGPIAHSNLTAVMLEYPVSVPGMTPGAAIISLIDEAQARGALMFNGTPMGISFDAVNDSNGNAWPVVSDMSAKVGVDMLSFLRELATTYIDFSMEPDSWTLNAYRTGEMGTASAVTLAAAVNVTTYKQDEET